MTFRLARLLLISFVVIALASPAVTAFAGDDELNVWIGSAQQEGVFHLTLDTETGTMSQPKKLNTLPNAGFLAFHPDGKTLYASARVARDFGVASYSVDELGANASIRQTGFVPTGNGDATCVAVDRTGRVVTSAQYGGGSTCSFLVDDDGAITNRVQIESHGPGSNVVPNRQQKAHPHWVGMSPDNRFLFVPDLGMDAVLVYELDAKTGQLKKHDTVACPPGGGPRHMKFHPNGKFAYVLNELTLTLSVFDYDAESGKLTAVQEIETVPDSQKDKYLNSAAEVRIHPNGKFVYASNRGHDSITVFKVDMESGKLSQVQCEPIRGSQPRNFNLDPSGKWLIAAGQRSNTLSLFEVDSESGGLTFARKVVNVPSPICVEFGGVKR